MDNNRSGSDKGKPYKGRPSTGAYRKTDKRSSDNRGGDRRDNNRSFERRDNDRPRRDNDGPRRDNDRPRRDNDRPRRDNDGRSFERRDNNRSFERRDNDRPRRDNDGPRRDNDGRNFERRDNNRSFERRDNDRPRRDNDGRNFERRDNNRGFERRDNDRPRRDNDGRSFERRDNNRSFERRDNDRPRRDFEGRDDFRSEKRNDWDREVKQSTQLDDEGYRSGVSATGMFVKPKYNKKFAVNEDKLTDPSEMSDAGRQDVIEGIREDRLEGRNPIREALTAGRTIDKLWVLKPQDGRFDKTVIDLVRDVKEQGGIIMEVERAALDRLSLTHAHQGVIAQTAVHEYVEVQDILDRATAKGEDALIIILDEIKDAYNLGSIFRIADAAGAHGVIIPKRRSVGLDAIVAKASAGAIEHVPCARVTNLVTTMKELKDAGLWIAGTAMEGSTEVSQADLSGPMAIVIGSEGDGMRELVQKNCDLLLSIPMKGSVNSLNAAVAAGIVIFETVRQRDMKGTATTEISES